MHICFYPNKMLYYPNLNNKKCFVIEWLITDQQIMFNTKKINHLYHAFLISEFRNNSYEIYFIG